MNPSYVVGQWYLDGFCTDRIITPVEDSSRINNVRWDVIKRCSSREEAEGLIKIHNESLLFQKAA